MKFVCVPEGARDFPDRHVGHAQEIGGGPEPARIAERERRLAELAGEAVPEHGGEAGIRRVKPE
jgi:hypothetical protein